MRLDLVRTAGLGDEWCVTVDGKCVIGFAGPDAHDRAEQHLDELRELLDSTAVSVPDDAAVPRPTDSD
jgi:hypothetical protein